MSRLLVIDVGNTHTTWGVYEDKVLLSHWRVSTSPRHTSDEWSFLLQNLLEEEGIKRSTLDRAVVSCVVPPVLGALEYLFRGKWLLPYLSVGPGVRTGLSLRVEAKEVGADRVVNALAASSLYGGDLIIVDFGTATTFCAVTKNKEYLGGVIAPGISISSEALYEKTAKLPRVDIEVPSHVVGKNTVEAMCSGIFFGHIGLSREIVKRMKEEFSPQAKVVGTGGWGIFLYHHCDFIDIFNPILTLEGLRIIHEFNQE